MEQGKDLFLFTAPFQIKKGGKIQCVRKKSNCKVKPTKAMVPDVILRLSPIAYAFGNPNPK
jgi:hypothetical protein